jgi:hypothetical protein
MRVVCIRQGCPSVLMWLPAIHLLRTNGAQCRDYMAYPAVSSSISTALLCTQRQEQYAEILPGSEVRR